MISLNRSKNRNDKAAALVELLIVFLISMTIIGGTIFFAIAYYRYSMIVNAGTATLRNFAVDTGISRTSTDVEGYLNSSKSQLESNLRNKLQTTFGISQDNADAVVVDEINSCVVHFGTSVCKLRAKVRWQAPCYFFCSFFKTMDIGTTVEAIVEDFCFSDPWTDFNCPCQAGVSEMC